jgi:hypothetical protein
MNIGNEQGKLVQVGQPESSLTGKLNFILTNLILIEELHYLPTTVISSVIETDNSKLTICDFVFC